MAKFAVIFLAALAFQASFAIPRFYEENTLFNYLDEIRSEVREISLYLEKDFPEDHLAVKTVTWQCQKLVEAVEVIISKLREETFTYQQDGLNVFRQVIQVLEEVRGSLRQVTVYRDISNIHELKKNFIVSINVVYEHFEKLVHLTYKLYPEFQYTLKYLIVDFVTALHGIRSHFVHINQGYEIVKTPRVLIKEIHEYTREFTDIVKEFSHPSQVKIALRGYLLFVTEIVRKLESESILGHKEIDVIVHHLTNKLREIVFPVTDVIDVKVFRTKVVSDLLEVVSIFEQLVQLCEDKVLPVEVRTLLLRIIYHYYYAIRHAVYEIKFAYKIGFYKPEYYNTEFYGKYGYGLYESEFHRRFHLPTNYNTQMYDIPFYYKHNVEDIHTPYRHETLFPVHKYDNEYVYGKSYGLNYHNKYFSGLKYDYQTPNDLVSTIRHLVQRVFETLEYNTIEVSEVKPALVYRIREFINVLDYILEKFETKVTFEHSFYNDKIVEEFIYRIKEIKRELREIINTEVITNVHDVKPLFVRYIQVVANQLTKWIETYEVRDSVLIKDISIRFITFLNEFSHQRTYNSEYYPVKEFSGYYHKYYKDNTIAPYNYNVYSHVLPFLKGGRLNYHTERYFPSFYNHW